MSDSVKEKLIGKTLKGYTLSQDKTDIIFKIKADHDGTKGKYNDELEPVVLSVYGDCCSESWIESVDNPAALENATVTDVEEIEMPDLGNQPDHDVMEYYGLKIVTTKGHCVIDYRNDSNGYYGGWIS